MRIGSSEATKTDKNQEGNFKPDSSLNTFYWQPTINILSCLSTKHMQAMKQMFRASAWQKLTKDSSE